MEKNGQASRSCLVVCMILTTLLRGQIVFAMDSRFELKPHQLQPVPQPAKVVSKQPPLPSVAHMNKQEVKKPANSRAVPRTHVRKKRKPRPIATQAAQMPHHSTALYISPPAVVENTARADVRKVHTFWDRLVPPDGGETQPLVFKSDSFNLVVDPLRYPLFKAADGGRIVVDSNGTLPPLVRSLMREQDPKVKIVDAPPSDGRVFLRSLLSAGGFYSVEEQPLMTFGTDPLVKIRSDFKVERTPESIVRGELLLVNASQNALPLSLSDFLNKQGVSMLEPFAVRGSSPTIKRHKLVRVSTKDQRQLVDSVLEALGVEFISQKRIDLFESSENGFNLSVVTDRYFERGGYRYIVHRSGSDPIAITLLRLLETRGYRVVHIEPKDDFRSVTGKLLSKVNLPANYTSQPLLQDPSGRYSVDMSGFLLENSTPQGGAVMLTDRVVDQSLINVLFEHGYLVTEH